MPIDTPARLAWSAVVTAVCTAPLTVDAVVPPTAPQKGLTRVAEGEEDTGGGEGESSDTALLALLTSEGDDSRDDWQDAVDEILAQLA